MRAPTPHVPLSTMELVLIRAWVWSDCVGGLFDLCGVDMMMLL